MSNSKSIRQISINLSILCLLILSACGGSGNNHETNSRNESAYSDAAPDDEKYDDEESPKEDNDFVLDSSCPDVEIGDRFYWGGTYSAESNRCGWSGVESRLDCPVISGSCTLCFYNTEYRVCARIDYKGECEGAFETITTCTPMGSSEDLIPVP